MIFKRKITLPSIKSLAVKLDSVIEIFLTVVRISVAYPDDI